MPWRADKISPLMQKHDWAKGICERMKACPGAPAARPVHHRDGACAGHDRRCTRQRLPWSGEPGADPGGQCAPTGTETATPSVAMVTNPGPSSVNLRNAPDLNAPEVGILAVQTTTIALGKTEDNLWILVEVPEQPGQTAWLYATLVQLSVPIDQLTVVTP